MLGYIPPLETRRTLRLREKHTHIKQLWTEGLSSCATSLPKKGHAAQPHANTSITATITTALAHTQVTNGPNSPVQAVDLAQKEKITSQANLPSNTVVILSNDVTETGESIKYSSKIGKYYLKTVK